MDLDDRVALIIGRQVIAAQNNEVEKDKLNQRIDELEATIEILREPQSGMKAPSE